MQIHFTIAAILLACSVEINCLVNHAASSQVLSQNNVTLDTLLVTVDYFRSEVKLKQAYPNAVVLEKFGPAVEPRLNYQYSLGRRIPGDRLVATTSGNNAFPTPHDVTVNLHYPAQGIGSVLTFVVIGAAQSSTIGKAYVVAGGLGQRFIDIAVVGGATTYFNWVANFYGY